MANELQRYMTRKMVELTGTMWCSHCQHSRPKDKGIWKTMADGKRRRWKCAQCVENHKKRILERASTATT